MNTDPIADLLTRLRNGSMAHLKTVSVPASRVKKEILSVMKRRQLIKDFEEKKELGPVGALNIELFPEKRIHLKRISKPGQRIYKKAQDLFPILRGYGFSIVSTSQGIMTGEEARKKGIGGELICELH